jgi:uncharacterized NAD-dependent epimerase/dehydratase family protein
VRTVRIDQDGTQSLGLLVVVEAQTGIRHGFRSSSAGILDGTQSLGLLVVVEAQTGIRHGFRSSSAGILLFENCD